MTANTDVRQTMRNLVERAQKIFLMACPREEVLTSEDYNPIKAWMADAAAALSASETASQQPVAPKDCGRSNEDGECLGCGEKLALVQSGMRKCAYANPATPGREPVAMLLYCPRCQMQHVDAADTEEEYTRKLHESAWWELGGEKPARWTNPPHATHTCKGCGLNWRPSNAPTVGVAAIPVAELGSEAKHIERMEATNPTLYVAPSSSAAEMRERAAKVCEDEAGKQGGLVALALDTVASRIRQLQQEG
jgi:hypothetical protein